MATLRVSVSYGMKVPVEGVEYASQDAHISYSIEDEIPNNLTKEQQAKQAEDLRRTLESGVKLAVFSALDVGFQDDGGVLRPVVTVQEIPHRAAPPPRPAPSAPQAAPQTGSDGSGGRDLPVVTFDYFRNGSAIQFYDQRPLKLSGKFNERAPDFLSVKEFKQRDGSMKPIPIWITGRDGSINERTKELMDSAGVS